MGYDLNKKLVIAISSRALFNLEEENKIFEEKGLDDYYKYQIENEDIQIAQGTGFRLVNNLLKINEDFPEDKQVEVIIMSRNNSATSLRITKSIQKYNLDIQRSAWTGGNDIAKYLKPFKVDLFLSANEEDVQNAINEGIASARILPYENINNEFSNQVKIAFDGDAVLFSEESEVIYKTQGLEAFLEHEKKNVSNAMKDGPFAQLLRVISNIQAKYPQEQTPIRTALITARNSPAHERVIRTLSDWNVRLDEAFFLGGVDKYEVVKAFGADIFFDDQDVHLETTSKQTPSAKVLYKEESILNRI
ncbi:5'-nucleotidase [Poseidonibacter lekithochrous]|uniref:5'-nucleotidase n=1 Tax=Poseidonibacter TaxID=2321187 RepID=UPI001C0908BD|nr:MULTISPECIES: 5'-nucleotidase [Poseidonibacter]MBU3015706.1 5'-nucleotidase [Poseidonibacter lekithochrous]MDO6829006.1 5'-nucleotidase [Poseidonibacter sp. 1_MG-2023]